MNALSIMLVPTRTIPGWPPAPEPTWLQTLGLLVGLPLLAILLTFAIAKIGNAVKAGRQGSAEVTDPVWVGGRQVEGGRVQGEELEEDLADEGTSQPGGGAGARW